MRQFCCYVGGGKLNKGLQRALSTDSSLSVKLSTDSALGH